MAEVVKLEFPKCCDCGERATKTLELVEWDTVGSDLRPVGATIKKLYCDAHYPEPLDRDQLALLLDERDAEIAALKERIKGLIEAQK